MHITTLAVAIAIPIALIQAQSPLSGLAHGVVIHDTSPFTNTRSLLMKPAGDLGLVPFTNVNSQAPTYTIEDLLHRLGSGAAMAAQQFEMSAISTGNDNLPIEQGPYSGLEPSYWQVTSGGWSGWAAIMLSVSNNPGTPIHESVFEERLQSSPAGRIGSDLFSYWFDTNVDLPPSLTDSAHFDLGFEHMGLAPNTQITGLDTYMPAIVEARGITTFALPVLNKWFFALTPESASRIRNNWTTYDSTFNCLRSEVQSNYVYAANWTPGQGWSQIRVLFDPMKLGLTEEDAIDAIAFFDVPNNRDRIVFSLTMNSPSSDEQLLVGGEEVRGPQGPGKKPLRVKGGIKITAKIGIGNDTDIDSICTYDPENPSQAYGNWIALPIPDTTPAGIGCSVARYRTYDQNGSATGEELLLQATNLPKEVAIVGWVITIGSTSPILIRELRTDDRMDHVMPLPPGVDEITVRAVYYSRTQTLNSWSVRLLRQ